jgi:hypothetical protein
MNEKLFKKVKALLCCDGQRSWPHELRLIYTVGPGACGFSLHELAVFYKDNHEGIDRLLLKQAQKRDMGLAQYLMAHKHSDDEATFTWPFLYDVACDYIRQEGQVCKE